MRKWQFSETCINEAFLAFKCITAAVKDHKAKVCKKNMMFYRNSWEYVIKIITYHWQKNHRATLTQEFVHFASQQGVRSLNIDPFDDEEAKEVQGKKLQNQGL